MAGKPTDDIVRCSFCNKTQAQVRKLIAGPNGTYICDECIGICSEIIEEELDYNERELFDDINLLTPEEMKAFLDDYVIGQDEANICAVRTCDQLSYLRLRFITKGTSDDIVCRFSCHILSPQSQINVLRSPRRSNRTPLPHRQT